MLEANTNQFTTYYPYYKNKIIGNPTWTFVYATNCLYFLSNLSNLLMTSLFTCYITTYTALPDLVTKKGKPSKTSLYLLSHLFQPLSFLFSSMLSKYVAMSKQQLSLILATKIMTKDCEYFTLIQYLPKAFFDLFQAT